MKYARFRFLVLALLSILTWTLPIDTSRAGTQDQAVIALHVKSHALKTITICGIESPNADNIPCSDYNTGPWPTYQAADVYLVVARADSAAGVAGVSCGIQYGPNLGIFGWELCANLEFPSASWPASGGGDRITWAASTNCQQTVIGSEGVHAVAGALYVYAYGNDLLEITMNNGVVIPELKVADCSAQESDISLLQVGKVGFGSIPGFNPGLPVCELSVTSLDFGSVQVEDHASRTFVIRNRGGVPFSGSVTESCSEFRIESGGGDYDLASGDSLTVEVWYEPTSSGTHACVIETGLEECADVSCSGSSPPFIITATAGANGTIEPSGPVSVNYGTDQAFAISADPGYGIADVLVDTSSVGPVTTYTFEDVTADHTITASFAWLYTISASAGPGGSISPSGAVAVLEGANKSFTITPNPGYGIVDVLVDGDSVGPVTAYMFENVTAGHSITASFALQHTITASAGPGGSIHPSGAVVVLEGASKEFAITPDPCHGIADVLVDGGSVGPVATYTFHDVTADRTIAAAFELLPVCLVAPADTLDFGLIEAGCYREVEFAMENAGSDTLRGTVGVSSGPFSILEDPAYALGPGQVGWWTVRFEPTEAGVFGGVIETGSTCCPDILCAGRAELSLPPVWWVVPTVVRIGTPIGTTAHGGFTIWNMGGGLLTGEVTEACDHFAILSGGGPFSLGCNQYRTTWLEFAPTVLGPDSCWISTGGAYPSVLCVGTGLEPPPVCTITGLDGDQLEFGEVVLMQSRDLSVVIKNTGGGTLTGTVAEGSGCDEFEFVSGGGAYNLGAGDSVVVTVRFTPMSTGTKQCYINTGLGCHSSIPGFDCTGVGILPNVLYVDVDATGAGTGVSWANAYPTLQQALAATPPAGPVMVWVAEGTYKPGSTRSSTFVLRNGWSLLGGFGGWETSPEQRNPAIHPTILSGEIGVSAKYDNCYIVVSAPSTVDSTALLDGFTITRGNGTQGCGMVVGGSLRIVDVRFVDNQASNSGGGLAVSPLTAGTGPTLTRVTFEGNRALGTVGTQGGGGMYLGGVPGSITRLRDVTFRGNVADRDGGGLNCIALVSPLMDGVLFVDNSAARYGGGLMSQTGSLGQFANLAFVGNTSQSMGGGLYLDATTSTTLTNASFSRNTATTAGGGIYFTSVGPHLVNAVLWGDTAPTAAEIRLNGTTPSVISYSLVQGCGGSGSWNPAYGTDGGHNLDADPLFVNALGGDLQLSPGSPAIDAGNRYATGLPATDLLGQPRISGTTVDLGAYESVDVTGVEEVVEVESPRVLQLRAYPNPFWTATTIAYSLPEGGAVEIDVCDALGRRVRDLMRREEGRGDHTVIWDGRDDAGAQVATGLYFVRVRTRNETGVGKLILVR